MSEIIKICVLIFSSSDENLMEYIIRGKMKIKWRENENIGLSFP